MHALLPTLLFAALASADGEATAAGDATAAATPREAASRRSLWLEPLDGGAPAEWAGNVWAGSTMARGNSELFTLSLGFDAERRSQGDRYRFDAYFDYAETQPADETLVVQRDSGAFVQYDRDLGPDRYLTLRGAAQKDSRAGLELRYWLGPALGHRFERDARLELSAEVGLAYLDEQYVHGDQESRLALRLGGELAWRVSDSARLEQRLDVLPALDDLGNVTARLDTRLRLAMTEHMYSRLSWAIDWDGDPYAGAERVDHRILVTLGFGF